MRTLTIAECQTIGAAADYNLWGQVGVGLGIVGGILVSLNGPMTGAVLAFKPFEIVLKGTVGAGIGLGAGLLGAVLYDVGVNIYQTFSDTAETGMKLAPLLLL